MPIGEAASHVIIGRQSWAGAAWIIIHWYGLCAPRGYRDQLNCLTKSGKSVGDMNLRSPDMLHVYRLLYIKDFCRNQNHILKPLDFLEIRIVVF